MPQQFNPVLPSLIRISGFIWPQSGFSRLVLFSLIVLNRLGFIMPAYLPKLAVFDFSVSKPSLENVGRREIFYLSFQSKDHRTCENLMPVSVWMSPFATFMWVNHSVSGLKLLLCLLPMNSVSDRHLACWIRSYKSPSSRTTRDLGLPMFGGLQ